MATPSRRAILSVSDRETKGVIRSWTGVVDEPSKEKAYLDHLETKVVTELQSLPGFQKILVLRRPVSAGTEFRVLSFWDSHQAIRAFAGDTPDVAVVHENAQALLHSYDRHVDHYEVAIARGKQD